MTMSGQLLLLSYSLGQASYWPRTMSNEPGVWFCPFVRANHLTMAMNRELALLTHLFVHASYLIMAVHMRRVLSLSLLAHLKYLARTVNGKLDLRTYLVFPLSTRPWP